MDIKKEFDVRCKLMSIARNLHICDKISVIFFICDKPYVGLKIMEILLATDSKALQNKAFFTWAKKQMLFSNTDWREKFAEILRTIQNYRLAKYLGFDKEELKEKTIMKNKLYTDEIKIILYKLCESLNKSQTARLIDTIDNEYNTSEVSKTFKYNYLERKILEWSVKNIISIDTNKKINLEPIIRSLEVIQEDNNIVSDISNAIAAAEFKLLKSIKTTHLQNSLPECYSIIDKSNLGFCLIINEKNFPGSDLRQRWGSNKDVERLKEVFTAFGFRIKIYTNVIYEKLIDLLNKYAKLLPSTDSFFVLIILSHGSENVIYTTDSVAVPMHTIEMIFQAENSPNLIGKPKIFIIQSCQGQKWQKLLQGRLDESKVEEIEVDVDAPHTSTRSQELILVGPQKGDSIIAWSTVQGYASFRDKHNGSWYIEELCKELWKFGQFTDLIDILTLVNNNLRSKVYDGQFMVPSLLSSLSGKVQFPYVEENWLRGRQLMIKRLFFEIYFLEFLKKSNISPVDLLKLQ